MKYKHAAENENDAAYHIMTHYSANVRNKILLINFGEKALLLNFGEKILEKKIQQHLNSVHSQHSEHYVLITIYRQIFIFVLY